MSNKQKSVDRVVKEIPFEDLPEQVKLQFNVNTDSVKNPKFKEKDIFEAKKKTVKEKKAMPKNERIKKTRNELSKLSAKNNVENEKIRNNPKYQMLEVN